MQQPCNIGNSLQRKNSSISIQNKHTVQLWFYVTIYIFAEPRQKHVPKLISQSLLPCSTTNIIITATKEHLFLEDKTFWRILPILPVPVLLLIRKLSCLSSDTEDTQTGPTLTDEGAGVPEGTHLWVGQTGEQRHQGAKQEVVVEQAVLTAAYQLGYKLTQALSEAAPLGAHRWQRVCRRVLEAEKRAGREEEGREWRKERESYLMCIQWYSALSEPQSCPLHEPLRT